MSLSTVTGKVVVITGAGSGIGRALALRCARAGALLALSDWDRDGLAESVALAEQAGAQKVRQDVVDVSDRAAVATWAAGVVEELGRVDLVVNNAGVSATGDFTDLSYDDLDWIVGINFWGVVHGSKEFLPHLVASGNGALVNISSLFGLVSVPGQSAYNATKYAVRGLTEAIREEMLVDRHPVTVTCVHPGGIRTGISRHGRKAAGLDAARIDALFDQKLAKMTPDRAAEIIVRAVLKNQARCLVGMDAHVMHNLAKLTGSHYQDIVARTSAGMIPLKKEAEAARPSPPADPSR